MPARAFLLERKAAYAAAGTSAGDDAAAGAGGKKPPLTSVQHAEQLVALLRQAHAPLAAEIELVLDELTGRFAPSAEVRVGGGGPEQARGDHTLASGTQHDAGGTQHDGKANNAHALDWRGDTDHGRAGSPRRRTTER